MRLVTGDETGILKDAWLEANTAMVLGESLVQDRTEEATAMCWWPMDSNPPTMRRILCARKSGVVETWECRRAESGGGSGPWHLVCSTRGLPSAPVAIAPLAHASAHVTFCCGGEICVSDAAGSATTTKAQWQAPSTLKSNEQYRTGAPSSSSFSASFKGSGCVKQLSGASKEAERRSDNGTIDDEDNAKNTSSGDGRHVGRSAKVERGRPVGLTAAVLRARNWREAPAQTAAIAARRTSCGVVEGGGSAAADAATARVAAVGGLEHDAAMVDLETGQVRWQARNVKHDRLELRVPVWVTALQFLSPDDRGGSLLAAATAFRQVRLYDARAQRRPVAECADVSAGVLQTEFGLTSLVVRRDGTEAIVGDRGGNVMPVNLRTMRVSGRFIGPSGSVRSLALHPSLPYLATVGLDRTARVFNVDSHELVHTSYLKQRLTAVLVDPCGIHVDSGSQDEEWHNGKDGACSYGEQSDGFCEFDYYKNEDDDDLEDIDGTEAEEDHGQDECSDEDSEVTDTHESDDEDGDCSGDDESKNEVHMGGVKGAKRAMERSAEKGCSKERRR